MTQGRTRRGDDGPRLSPRSNLTSSSRGSTKRSSISIQHSGSRSMSIEPSGIINVEDFDNLQRKQRISRAYFEKRNQGEKIRPWIRRNLEDSLAGYLLDVMMAILAIVIVIFYVTIHRYQFRHKTELWVKAVDIVVNSVFTTDFAIRLLAAHNRFHHLRSRARCIDFLVLIPSWISVASFIFPASPLIHSLLELVQPIVPLRILRLHRLLEFTKSSLQRQILAAFIIVISIIVATAGVLQVIESCEVPCIHTPRECECQDLSFFDFQYFVWVSISTVGYGDIAPVSMRGKFLIAAMLLLTFVLVPIQINRIATIISSHTDYSSSYREVKQHPHIILTGWMDEKILSTFFAEFFHASNMNWNEKIVILNPKTPSVHIKKLLNVYETKIQYIVGSPLLDEDLSRAMIRHAKACYVFVHRDGSMGPRLTDQCVTLITIALRRGNSKVPIYTQAINKESIVNLLKVGATDVVATNLLKYSILARSCEIYGLPTLLLNLIAKSHGDMDSNQTPVHWQKPYLHGFAHSIFLVDIPRTFSGLTFGDLIRFLYSCTDVIPIALLTERGFQFVDYDFKLGVTPDPKRCCKVYAIAKDLNAVEDIMNIPPEQILSYRKNTRKNARISDANTSLGTRSNNDKDLYKEYLSDDIAPIHKNLINAYNKTVKPSGDFFLQFCVKYSEFIHHDPPVTITDHIVVCGFPADATTFLETIQNSVVSNTLQQHPKVIFLSQLIPSEEEYSKIGHFSGIYFVKGTPVNFEDLRKTRIETCMSIIILTPNSDVNYSDPHMVDADAITALRYVVEINERTEMPNIVVELQRTSNVKLLSSLANDKRVTATLSLPERAMPRLASTRQFRRRSRTIQEPRRSRASSSQLSTRGDMVLSLNLEKSNNLLDFTTIDRSAEISLALEEFTASGRVYMNSFIDALMSECYRKPWITSFLSLLIHSSVDDQKNRKLFQIPIPMELVPTSYDRIFHLFLDKLNCTCIGLWRPERGVILPHPCVFVNPNKGFQLEIGDLLFLIGKPLSASAITSFAYQYS